MKPNPVERSAYDQVKSFHQNSDIDESPIAQHHTLGALPSQASPGDHVHDGTSSRKIKFSDLADYTETSGVQGEPGPKGDTGPAGGDIASGTAVVDFGDGSSTTETVVTGVAHVLTTSVVMASMRIIATADHTVAEMLADPIRLAVKDIVTGVGFTIFAAMDNSVANGTYNVNWIVG